MSEKKSKRCYFIAGGGTGGHIYPGLAIGKALRELDPGCEVYFVGTKEGLETKLVPEAGFKLFLIQGGKLNFKGRYWEKVKTLIRLPLGFFQSMNLLFRYPPQAVLGVGGYASGPFVLMASLLGFRTTLWEPNAYPGLANRWLARFVDRAFVVFKEASGRLKGKNTLRLGMPVRAEIEEAYRGASASPASEQTQRPFRILCFGGSQGARAVNEALAAVLEKLGPQLENLPGRRIEVVHQIGSTDWTKFQKRYEGYGAWLKPMEFLKDMPVRYAWCDLVIARAGASTVAEISAFGKPAILIPLPGAEAHQEKNAEALSEKGAVRLLRQSDLTPDRLWFEIEALKNDEGRRKDMSAKVLEFFEPRSAHQIAAALVELSGHP